MKRFVIPALLVVFVVVEVILALTGPMAFVQKPSMIVTLPFAFNMEEDELTTVFEHVQEALARTRVFRVIPHSLIVDYYLEKEDNPDVTIDFDMSWADYQEMALDLDLERVAVISVYPGPDDIQVSIALRNITTDSVGPRFRYTSPGLEAFLEGEDVEGRTFDIADDLREEVRGVSLFDNLVFLLFGGQILLAILLAFGRKTDLLNQVLLVAGLLLFLFAFVYAKNASMDYVQRFIANKGAISLAETTLTEQLFALARFGPLFAVNAFLYIAARLRRRAPSGVVPRTEIVQPFETGWRTRITIVTRTWGLALALLGALLFSLSFPSFLSIRGFAVLAWFALVPLFLVIIHCRPLPAMVYVVSFGSLTAVILNYWHGTYSYISLAFSVIIIGLFFILLAPLIVFAARGLGRWGFAAMPFLWVAFDFARSIGYIGYPWGLFGVSQYRFLPLIQVADLAGVWAVTFILVLVNSAIAWTLAYKPRRTWIPLASAGGLAVLALIYGAVSLISARSLEPRDSMRIVLVQQNTDPRKHDYQLSFDTLKEQTSLALAASAPRIPDLVVWPEGGFKADIRYWRDRPRASSSGKKLVDQFMEYTSTLGTYLVTGTQDHVYVPEGEDGEDIKRNYNSSVFVDNTGEVVDFYHKIHLVPFTEHFPYKDRFPALAALLDKFDTSDWKQGEERTVFDHPVGDFFTPICFEDIFPNDIRRFVDSGADVIVNISNDYWSLDPVQGKQHAAHAMFRAIENRRPMVRATSSGLTTAITPEGRMSEEFPPYYTAGYLTVDVPIHERRTTLYTRAGGWLPWLSMIASVLALVFVIVRRIVHTRQNLVSGGE